MFLLCPPSLDSLLNLSWDLNWENSDYLWSLSFSLCGHNEESPLVDAWPQSGWKTAVAALRLTTHYGDTPACGPSLEGASLSLRVVQVVCMCSVWRGSHEASGTLFLSEEGRSTFGVCGKNLSQILRVFLRCDWLPVSSWFYYQS